MIGEWIRFGAAAVLIGLGLVVAAISVFGVFRLDRSLNRMHSAAMDDTLGISLVLSGLIVISGFTAISLKLLCVIIFLWMAGPVSSHLIARLEAVVGKKDEGYNRRRD